VGHLLLLRNGIAPMDDRDDLMSIHESLGVILVHTCHESHRILEVYCTRSAVAFIL
jgi:hypothetical protein